MVLSWLITIPLVCCIAISFFVSYNKIKVLFWSFFPPYICLFFFFLFDKFYFDYKVLNAIGKGFYEFLKPRGVIFDFGNIFDNGDFSSLAFDI